MKHTLREWRHIKEVSQAELAKRLNVSSQTIYNREENPGNLTITKAVAVAQALGVSIDDVIFVPSTQQNVESVST